MKTEKEMVLDFKKNYKINKVTFKERTHLGKIPLQIEYDHFVRGKNNFIYSNGLISKEEETPEKNEINDILIEKIGVYIRQNMKDRLQKELDVNFNDLKVMHSVYYTSMNFFIFNEKKQTMLFEKIPNRVNITLMVGSAREGFKVDTNSYVKIISAILESLISEEEHIFLLNTSKNLVKQYKQIVGEVALNKFKETKEYKMRCLYDKDFEQHFMNNGFKNNAN